MSEAFYTTSEWNRWWFDEDCLRSYLLKHEKTWEFQVQYTSEDRQHQEAVIIHGHHFQSMRKEARLLLFRRGFADAQVIGWRRIKPAVQTGYDDV